jgi:hypothetical protein
LRQTAFLTNLYKRRQADLAAAENELRTLGASFNDLIEGQEACKVQLERMGNGDFGGPRDHIQHAHSPQPPITKSGRFVYWWAAVSGGVILLLILPILYIQPASWPFWLVGIIFIFGAVDSATRGQLPTYLLRLTLFFSILTSLILFVHFWWLVIILGLMLVVIIGIRDNIRELGSG